jgi:uncharacterized membrane protein YraQ (UPF0718 family)
LKKRKGMNPGLLFASVLTLGMAIVAFRRDPNLLALGLKSSGRLLSSVWMELLLGFLMAGLLEVLLPSETLLRWLGSGSGAKGIFIGWLAGLAIPGGPYVFFPVAAGLFSKGASPAALMTLLAAKTLASPVRALAYEVPLLGWNLALARLLPALIAPPLLGLAGGVLFHLLKSRAPLP